MIKGTGATYTGTYIDVAGLGVVATGMTQMTLPGLGAVVVAIDVALGTDWIEKIVMERPKLLPLDAPADGKSAASWAWVASQAPARGAGQLAQLAGRCPGLQREFDTVAACAPDEGPEGGLLTATLISVSSSNPTVARWLIAWMPPQKASLELAQYLPALLLALAALAYALRERQYQSLECCRESRASKESAVEQPRAQQAATGIPPFRFDLQGWSDDLHLTTRIEGAETFIFDELLINAFKHGKPGLPPTLTARVIRGAERRWIEFELRNEVRSTREARVTGADHRYGGQTLVQDACRRLRWELQPPQLQGEVYVVRWRARSIEAAEDSR